MMKMGKGMMMKMSNHSMMRVLELWGLMYYFLCWYSRAIFAGVEGEVVVNLICT